MFARPGLCGMGIGRLGLVAASRPGLVVQALAILAKYGSAANLYLPGVGAVSGITAGNWLDNIGTTAATVDNTVGLVVSAAKQVGPERITNGDFGSGTTGWTAALNVAISNVGNALRMTSSVSGLGARIANQTVTGLVVGATYRVTASVLSFGGSGALSGFPQIQIRNAADTIAIASIGAQSFTNTTISGTFVATETSQRIRPRWDGDAATNSTSYLDFDNISLRELTGAHLTQSTAANRPILRQSDGVYSWQLDGSNDHFATGIATTSEGYYVGGALCTSSGVTHTIGGGSGGAGDADAGVWIARQSNGNIRISVGNGTTRNSLLSQNAPINSAFVASAGWSLSSILTGVNNFEVSTPNAINCATSRQIFIGTTITGASTPYLPMIGNLYAQIWIFGTTPSASERETLRRFIASLSGVTM